MNSRYRRKFALVCVPILLLLIIVGQTELVADDRVFYGLVGLFVISQIACLIYIFRQSKVEWYADLIRRKFGNE